MRDKDDDFEIVETLGKGAINFGRVLMIHLSRMGNRASEPLARNEESADAFKNSVIMLEQFLKPWWTEEYEKRKREIKERTEPVDEIVTPEEWFMLVGELMVVLRNSDLLPAEGIEVSDSGVLDG